MHNPVLAEAPATGIHAKHVIVVATVIAGVVFASFKAESITFLPP